ncbi:exosome complex component RRP45-like isoform X1 [Vespa mandarinia]|uniref:exosome complex component RRP45-like isoform X1 n=1 Tax=Vespa mandarinia TaxID=7446 RepID=UPI00161BA19F|nr:exosome complex component RRP45-like isoform X1 [Vespa mandarinia]
MKKTILTNCERNFINASIQEKTRLDGRDLFETRSVNIYFGSNWGSCIVSLGKTRAVAQVSCDIQQPKASRPNEGMIYINVELNPLAAQHFESNRQSEAAILINRQLEKSIKDSKCVDLESLCIVAEKKVWSLRLDINILNHDGNLIDCASIAALAALLHFHRPDVTSTGTNIIIHPFNEKDPLPLRLFFLPVCVSFITFESGITVMDPTYMEERVGVAQLTLGVNSYKELCSLHFDYLTKTLTVEDVISVASNHAAEYAIDLIQQIKEAVVKDISLRFSKDSTYSCHIKECIIANKLTTMCNDNISIKLRNWNFTQLKNETCENDDDNKESNHIVKLGEGFAELITHEAKAIGKGGHNSWCPSSEEEMSDVEIVSIDKPSNTIINKAELDDDSEEEVIEIVDRKDIM